MVDPDHLTKKGLIRSIQTTVGELGRSFLCGTERDHSVPGKITKINLELFALSKKIDAQEKSFEDLKLIYRNLELNVELKNKVAKQKLKLNDLRKKRRVEETCNGCIHDLGGQGEHMEPGGCLYESPPSVENV